MTHIKAAFEALCADAHQAAASYVSLYVTPPFYGGPEEGGWWGSDDELVSYQRCSNEVEAKALSEKVQELAVKMSKDARDNFNRHCAQECEWLEERGLDDDYLPQPDGEERYWVATESRPGERVSQGDRHYS